MEVAEKEKYRFLFVTLAIKNCLGVDLPQELTNLYAGSMALLRRKKYKNAIHGWMRALEVTHNTKIYDKSFNTYHPHIHMIWVVKPSYFKGGNYISQDELTNDWQKAMKIDYKPTSVDIRAIKKGDKKSIKEVSKYAVKPADILVQDWDLTDQAVWTLDRALKRRRMVAYGGILKTIKADLNLDCAETGDLINTDGEQSINEELNVMIERYKWNVGLGFHQRFE